ncbi:MAG: hypothetical protein KDD94_11255, partial [Calditrichaeota bacterium]|nr:hypothetical protein [Calditrichota bacterium]
AINELDDKRQRFQDKYNELEKQIKEAEHSIEKNTTGLKKDEENLYAVKNNKEYDALTLQINTRRDSISENKQFIEAEGEKLNLIKKHIEEYEEQLKSDRAILDEYNAKLSEKIQETEKEEKSLLKQHDDFKKKLESQYYATYTNIRSSKNDAVVVLQKNACSGCNAIIPLQMQAEVKKMKKLVNCESCGRIIIPAFDEN